MKTVSLAAYLIKIKKDGSKGFLNINNFSNGNDLLHVLEDYLKIRKKDYLKDDNDQKCLGLSKYLLTSIGVSGHFVSGDFGDACDIYDTNKMNVVHTKRVNESVMPPLYFLADFSKNSTSGLFLLERFNQFGFKSIFFRDFREYFNSRFPGFKIGMLPIIPERLIREIIKKGRITKLRLIKHKIPKDIADEYLGDEENEGSMELALKAKRRFHLPISDKINRFLNKEGDLNRLFTVGSFEPDTVKIEVISDRNKRTIELANLDKVRALFDITNEVSMGKDGHPVFESIDNVAKSLADDLLKEIV